MSDHAVTAGIKHGRVRATDAQDSRTLDYAIDGFSLSDWSCTCGKDGMTEAEAAQHLLDTD